jgi:peptidoglycan DL-endopeptidase CwlO
MSRVSARATLAAVTTGTVAVSGVALAGCATGSGNDGASLDEASMTSPIRLGAVTAVAGHTESLARVAAPVRRVVLRAKDTAALAFTKPTYTTKANQPLDVGVRLTNARTHAALANQKVRLVVKMHNEWQSFKVLRTDRTGYAHYTARILTTTYLTAAFDGTDAVKPAKAHIATMTVPVAAAPSVSAQASRATTRPALTVTPAAPAPPASTAVTAVGSSLGQRAVYLASLQAGKPYVYGGSGPYNFDCSGLVQYVFKQLGRTLPRTAEQQYEATTRISQSQMQVGDLIFFGSPGSIGHVGIYAGNNQMWDAPHSGTTVQLQTIWSTSYSVGRVN